jgi:hypothetical protein
LISKGFVSSAESAGAARSGISEFAPRGRPKFRPAAAARTIARHIAARDFLRTIAS